MSLHYRNGGLMLRHSNFHWYLLDVTVDAGEPRLRVGQVSLGTYYTQPWDTSAILVADDGSLIAIGVFTNDSGQLDYTFNPAETIPYPPSRIILKDPDTGLRYLLQGLIGDDGVIYPNLLLVSAQTTSAADDPFACLVPVEAIDGPCIEPVEALALRQIIRPPSPARPQVILDENGHIISGEGGGAMLGES